MTPEELSSLTIPAIDDMNSFLVDRAEHDLFRIGALWSEIAKREIWSKEWKYDSWIQAIEERAPRGYSTVIEQVANYNFFVREGRLSYNQYHETFKQLGHRKISHLRRDLKVQEQADGLRDEMPHIKQEIFKMEVAKLTTMTVQESKAYVLERSKSSGVELDTYVDEHYRWTKEQYELIQQEVEWMSQRAHKPLSNQSAIAFALQEHLATFGTRKIQS
jgi:hypothetical protein